MATGAPDWQGLQWKVETTQRDSLLYPTGKQMFSDSFTEPPLDWIATGVGTETINLTTEHYYSGNASVKLQTENAANKTAMILRYIGTPLSKKIGMELTWSMYVPLGYLEFGFTYSTATREKTCKVKYVIADEKWQYLNKDDGMTDIENGNQPLLCTGGVWNKAKLIIDGDASKYVSFYSNDVLFNLRDIPIRDVESPGYNYFIPRITVGSAAVAAPVAGYIDNVTILEE